MKTWLSRDGAEVRVGRKEIDLLNTCVGARLDMEGKEEIRVCEAIQQMIDEASEKVKRETSEKAAREASAKAAEAARKAAADAAEYMQLQGVQNLIKNLHFTAEQAINALGISEADGEKILMKL